jgi:hypothetical protein
MTALTMAARRLTKAAADLDAEQHREGGPRSREIRRIADDLFTAAGGLISAAYDVDADRARGT